MPSMLIKFHYSRVYPVSPLHGTTSQKGECWDCVRGIKYTTRP